MVTGVHYLPENLALEDNPPKLLPQYLLPSLLKHNRVAVCVRVLCSVPNEEMIGG